MPRIATHCLRGWDRWILLGLACLAGWVLVRDPLTVPQGEKATPLYAGVGGLEEPMVEREFLKFDRGEFGVQVQPPAMGMTEAWREPLLVRKASDSVLPLPEKRTRWRFLSEETRRAIRDSLSQGEPPSWRRLVVHGSGSATGSAVLLATDLQCRRPDLDMPAYHFVIGNGSFSGDGEVEVGVRWEKQAPSASFHLPELNVTSLSVCLIGPFQEAPPSRAQWRALDELYVYLQAQLGPLPLVAHHEVESTAVGCPGPALTRAHLDQLKP